ncbi:MAG: DUF4097 and DUF4098 domain-containing protein YvlB [Candidatus Azotimanducaceae bacterium]|jgi:DUF4097 and DUF4098 domain-containing protein YvlB
MLVTATLQAEEEIDLSKKVQADGLIKIDILRGDIEIEGWSEARVQVKGELDELAEGLRFEVRDGVTEIEVEMPRQYVNWGDGSNLIIYVPMLSRVAVKAVATDIEVSDVLGGMQVRSISGDITLTNGQKQISLKTVSGNIETSKTSGKLEASSASGDIQVKAHQGNLGIETLSGDIEIEARSVSRLRGASISGDLAVEAAFDQNVSAELTSVSGRIRVSLDGPLDLTFRVNSNSGGIDNELTNDKVVDQFGMHSLQGQLGSGTGSLTVRSVSGAIELEEG